MTQAKGNLLIIGASSLVGQRLRDAVDKGALKDVLAEGSAVRFTSRKALDNQVLILDLLYPQAFKPGMKFTSIIVCTPIWLIDDNVLNRFLAIGLRRLVVFSSTSRFTKDTSAEPAEREVAQKLAAGEESIIAFCETHSVDYTILRPTLIYDEGRDENVSQIADFIRRRGFFPVCGAASGLRQPVHARDLARAAAFALVNSATFGRDYNLSGGETLTYLEMVRRIFAGLGKTPFILSVPEILWRIGLGFLKLAYRGNSLKYNINMAKRMNADLCFDSDAAREDFGYKARAFHPEFKA